MKLTRPYAPALLALIIAGVGFSVGPLLPAQNQGTYLFLEFAGAEPTSAIETLGLIEVEVPDSATAAPATDTANVPAPNHFTSGSMSAIQGTPTTGTLDGDDAFDVSAPSSFSAPSGSFSDSAFGEPSNTAPGTGGSFFNEDAFTNPAFGK